jgi:hypothetical protein
MRRILSALGTVTVLAIVACSKQSLGQVCNPAFGNGADGDCESPLVCLETGATAIGGSSAFCCPSVPTADAPNTCRPKNNSDAAAPPPLDSGAPDSARDAEKDATIDAGVDAGADATGDASDGG